MLSEKNVNVKKKPMKIFQIYKNAMKKNCNGEYFFKTNIFEILSFFQEYPLNLVKQLRHYIVSTSTSIPVRY